MRKQEYIHVHALFEEVARYLVDRDAIDADALADYEASDAGSVSVYESKERHHAALVELAATIESSLDPVTEYQPDLPAR